MNDTKIHRSINHYRWRRVIFSSTYLSLTSMHALLTHPHIHTSTICSPHTHTRTCTTYPLTLTHKHIHYSLTHTRTCITHSFTHTHVYITHSPTHPFCVKSTGTVSLRSSDPYAKPIVDCAWLHDAHDVAGSVEVRRRLGRA